MDKPQIIAHVQKSLNYTLFDTKWIPCSAKFVVLGNHARGTGAMQVYEISHGDVKLVQEVDLSKISNIIKITVIYFKTLAQNVRTECSLDLESSVRVPITNLYIFFVPFQFEKSKPFKCGTFAASSLQQRYLATGDFEGRMQIWYTSSLSCPEKV